MLELLARLGVAAGVAAAIGMEREWRNRPAGATTHTLVGIGAAAFTIAGAYGFQGEGANFDPSRVAAQVATGIGFVGAGAILRTRGSVRGLTTAATLWVVAALGVGAGAGLLVEAAVGGAFVLLATLLIRIVSRILTRSHRRILQVEYERGHGTLGPVLHGLEDLGDGIGSVHVDDHDGDAASGATRTAEIEVTIADRSELDRLVNELRARDEVHHVAVLPTPSRRSD